MASLKQKIEALLFVAGRPVALADLAKFAQTDQAGVKTALSELESDYCANERGIQLLQNSGEAQLVSHGETRSATEPFFERRYRRQSFPRRAGNVVDHRLPSADHSSRNRFYPRGE